MYISVGSDFVQPKILLHGCKGREVYERIMTEKLVPTSAMLSYSNRREQALKKLKAVRRQAASK